MEPVDMVLGSGSASGTMHAVKQYCDLQSQPKRVIIMRLPVEKRYIIFLKSNPLQIMW